MEFSINAVTRRQLLMGAMTVLAAMTSNRAASATTRQEREAGAFIERLVGHILQLIGAGHHGTSQERRLMAAIESQTDLSLLARMTMGRNWRRASAQQQDVYVDVFGRYLLLSFTSRLRRYAGTNLGTVRDRFAIIGTQPTGKNDIIVRSQIYPPSGASLQVDWRLRSKGDRLFIIDLVVEGVSLLVTQRSEFGSVVERIGIDGLIGELRSRVAQMT